MPRTRHTIIRTLRRLDDQSGLTLIEVLVTALVVALIASAVATALIATSHASGDQRMRAVAASIAAQDQERLRGMSDQQLANVGTSNATPRKVDSNGIRFTVTSTAAFQDARGNSSCGSTAVDYYKVSSTVSWQEGFRGSGAQSQSVSSDSALSRPVTGQLQTAVKDETGAPLAGAMVSAAPLDGQPGQGNQSAMTDSDGCALMSGLQAGNYSLNASKSGYVDTKNMSLSAGSTSVTTSGAPTTNSFTLGLAGTIDATFSTYATGVGGEANAISYQGAGTTTTLTVPAANPAATASASFVAANLFPFNRAATGTPSYANNWTAYAGRCAYQAPKGTQTQYTVRPGDRVGAPSASPAQPTTTGIQEPVINLSSITGKIPVNGKTPTTAQPVQPTDIVLSYNADGCSDQYEATIAPPASGAGVGAAPPATGWLGKPGQPYAPSGDLSICADYASTSGSTTSWYSGTTGTSWSNTSMSAVNSAPAITLTAGARCAGAS